MRMPAKTATLIPFTIEERTPMKSLTALRHLPAFVAASLLVRLTAALHPRASERERGDVPGWVMITLMSAVLVAAILVVARTALVDLFNSAIDQVRQ